MKRDLIKAQVMHPPRLSTWSYHPHAMRLAVFVLAVGTLVPGSVRAQHHDGEMHRPAARWSGGGSLHRPAAQTSADRRFALEGGLQADKRTLPGDPAQRFAMRAQLFAPKALSGSCAGSVGGLFYDGFEEGVQKTRSIQDTREFP